VDNPEEYTVLSLCTGYGGLDIGLAGALQRPLRVVAVEIEAFAAANLVAKAEAGKLAVEAVWPDVKTFPAEKFRGCFDIITAGYPCQPFSCAGKRQGDKDPRHLWPYIRRIADAVKPLYILLENVPGLCSTGGLDNRPDIGEYLAAIVEEEQESSARTRWYLSQHRRRLTNRLIEDEGIQAFAAVYLDLHDLGYSVEAGLFTAAECGAPHRRERLFILAQSRHIRQTERKEQPAGVEQSSELADTSPQRLQKPTRRKFRSFPSQAEQTGRGESCGVYAKTKWPARPGQPQYEWEEPRVVADSKRKRHRRGTEETHNNKNERNNGDAVGCEVDGRSCISDRKGQTQSRLGRAVDGPSSRVDRLRLLGNGVVPQCAAKAWINLCNTIK